MKNRVLCGIIFSAMLLSACGNSTSNQSTSIDQIESDLSTTVDTKNMSTGYINTNGEDYVNLYLDDSCSNVISRMYNSEPVTVYSIQGDLANISYGGMVGYVELKYISFTEPSNTESSITEEVTTVKETVNEETAKPNSNENSNSGNQLNQNIQQNVNIVFLADSDGFEFAQPSCYPSYVSDDRDAWCSAESIYIYSEPSTSSSKREADMLYYGDTLNILGSVDEWYYIATDSGNGYDLHGYVKKSYITIGQTPVAPEPDNASYGRVSVKSANVRSSPNKETNDNVLFAVHQGDEFEVLDYDGYWYKINYNGTICYISHKMVEVW